MKSNHKEEIMELTGKLKEDVAKCETRDEAKDKIKDAGVILNDEELDSIAGGIVARRPQHERLVQGV